MFHPHGFLCSALDCCGPIREPRSAYEGKKGKASPGGFLAPLVFRFAGGAD